MYDVHFYDKGDNAGCLHLHQSVYLSRLNVIPSEIYISSNTCTNNRAVVDYIRQIYADYYDATINVRYPTLFSLRNPQGDILAAVGLRAAQDDSLFLEQYLETGIEDYVQTSRQHIVEIGNLASNCQGATMLLFTALSAYLNDHGFTHAAITGTSSLGKKFERMGLEPQRLASADPSLLLQQDECWGSYYATNPQVLVGSVTKACQRLTHILNAEYYSQNNAFTQVAI